MAVWEWRCLVLVGALAWAVEATIYSGPCNEMCCCKVCSSSGSDSFPYGLTTQPIASNPTNPQLLHSTCHIPVWSEREYNDTYGNPVTAPQTLWWASLSVFGDFASRVAPTTCSCCQFSTVDTTCSEERPRAKRPTHFYILTGRAQQYSAAKLVFEGGIELNTTDFVELRNDTFCGYSTPSYVQRSSASELNTTTDATSNTWSITSLPKAACYQVCYYHSGLTTPTWYPLGSLTVYTTPEATYNYYVDPRDVQLTLNSVTITFYGRNLLSPFGDEYATIQSTGIACGAGTPTKSTATGTDGRLEVAEGSEWCKPAVIPGITTYRPLRYIAVAYSDCTTPNRVYQRNLTWTVTLPAAGTYRVCYGTTIVTPNLVVSTSNTLLNALILLRTATSYTTWIHNTGWGTMTAGTVCSAHGIRCDTGKIISIFLGRNNLTGTLPPNFFLSDFAPTLERLSLDMNQISSTIPREIGALRKLRHLDLSFNVITGTVPVTLQRTSLELLYLSNNLLSGFVPTSLHDMQVLWAHYTNMVPTPDDIPPQGCPTEVQVCTQKGSTDVGVSECGYTAITQRECEVRGCCFNQQAPLTFGGTSCFTKRSSNYLTHPQCAELFCTPKVVQEE